jgi:MFS family permease
VHDVVSPSDKRTLWSVITASSVGTLIEWYDFYIFGSLSLTLSQQFFPKENPTAAFLATLAAFAAGFIVRPFGALVFGRLGDKVGRKHTFLITLMIMGGSTFAIGLIPSYATIGLLAPVLVVILRLLQGLALGGEYGGAATYVAEHAPAAKRGFYTSFIQTTATLGFLLSLGVILLVRQQMDEAAFAEWGWRLPFILSIFLVLISIYIRLRMKESPLFAKIKAAGKLSANPLRESFMQKENLRMVLIALFGITAGQGVVWYTSQFYALSFIQNTCHLDFVQSNVLMAIALILGTPLFIFFGGMSDRTGRKIIMLLGLLLAIVFYKPIYRNMYALTEVSSRAVVSNTTEGNVERTQYADGTSVKITTTPEGIQKKSLTLGTEGQVALVGLLFVQLVFVTMVYGPIAAFLVELFPTRIRYTSMSLPYHLGNGVFGGLTPLIATSLFEFSKSESQPSGDPFAGLWYPIIVAIVTLIVGFLFLPGKMKGEVDEL